MLACELEGYQCCYIVNNPNPDIDGCSVVVTLITVFEVMEVVASAGVLGNSLCRIG